MQKTSLTSRFLAGFTPQPLPPRGPMGMAGPPPPARLAVISPPSLCEAGPCRNYHRVVSAMEAQEPLDGSGEPVHPQITRACYPTAGIEIELGETPVLQCSRWEPNLAEESRLGEMRRRFLTTTEGKKFRGDVDAFEKEVARQEESQESAEAGGGLTGVATDLGDDDVDDLIGGGEA